MNDTKMKEFDIVVQTDSHVRYRVISISEHSFVLCKMDIESLELVSFERELILSMFAAGYLVIENEDDRTVIDIDHLSEIHKASYDRRLAFIHDVLDAYGPDYLGLSGKHPKEGLYEIYTRYSLSKATAWRIIRKYFQSGFNNYSLIDGRALNNSHGRTYNYRNKPGPKSKHHTSVGVILTDEIIGIFTETLNQYKKGKHLTIRAAYDAMNIKHFSRVTTFNGEKRVELLPVSERPTIRQLYDFIARNLTCQEKDLIKTSAREQRNNKRLLLGSAVTNVFGPCDMVEIDACEVDVALVSSTKPDQAVGRPIVYFMIDVYTRIILAMSVSFDNNSLLGLSSLFLNLCDDKGEYCAKFGKTLEPGTWPSNVLPRRIRCDRGSDFKSAEFGRFCLENNIEKELVSGGSGSLKGVIEQSFHQMHAAQNIHLVNFGLIRKSYDSNHHKTATLTIEECTRLILNFVIMHNQKSLSTYELTKGMIMSGVKPVPIELWNYGIKKYSMPRPITNPDSYMFSLLFPVSAGLSRKGISFQNLTYLPDDDDRIFNDMFNCGRKKQPFEARMDRRDISRLYYLRDGVVHVARLNTDNPANEGYENLTFKEYRDICGLRNELIAEGKLNNEQLSAQLYAENNEVVKSARKRSCKKNNTKDIRPNREAEKQNVSAENSIATRMPAPVSETSTGTGENAENENPISPDMTLDEALTVFNNIY